MFTCSAETGLGRQDLLGVIEVAMKAIQAEANQLPPSKEPQLPPTRKRGPDLNRPW